MISTANPRLVRADIAPHPGGGLVLTTPRGKVFRVHLTETELVDALAKCDGQRSLTEVAAADTRSAELRDLLERLQDEGCLDTSAAEEDTAHRVRFPGAATDPDHASPTELTIVGTGRMAAMATDLLYGVDGWRFAALRRARAPIDMLPPGRPAGSVALLILDHFDLALLTEFENHCQQAGIRWSYFYFDVHHGWFGPHVQPGGGPAFGDVYARRLAAAPDPTSLRARENPAANRDRYLPPTAEIVWMLSAYLADVERWMTGLPAQGTWHEVELDPVQLQITRRPVLPMPDSPAASLPPGTVADPAEMLVDERLGIVTQLRTVPRGPQSPATLATVQAVGSDLSRVRPWRHDPVGGGSNFGDAEAARKAAVGELIERYCGNIVRPELLTEASWEELTARGEHAVDPDSLVLFSPAQYAAPGFPFAPLTRDKRTHWVRGRSLTHDIPAWLPASMVYVNWYNTEYARGAPTNGAFFAGIAAGPDLPGAINAGLLEVIERHATMAWWLNRHPLPAVAPTADLQAAWAASQPRDQLRGWLINIDNEFSVPVFAGVVEDTAEKILTIGFAARAHPEAAALKAWAEGLILQEISHDLLARDSVFNSVLAKGRLPDQGLKPWRADRRYLEDYRCDFRDVTTLICQPQVHLDPRAVEQVRPWVDVPQGRELAELPRLEPGLTALQRAVEATGREVFYADVTTPDVAATGLAVTRTLVTGTIGNFPAAFPFLGRRMIQDSAVRLGWRAQPLAEDELTTIPVPHA
jgi:ribosomal protein S12 methylthiotransferase accessory factor